MAVMPPSTQAAPGGHSTPAGPAGLGQHLFCTKLHLPGFYAKPSQVLQRSHRRLCPAEKGSRLRGDHVCGAGYGSPQLSLHHRCCWSAPRAAEHRPRSSRAHGGPADFAGIGGLPVLSSIACQLIFPFHPRETQRLCRKKVLPEIHGSPVYVKKCMTDCRFVLEGVPVAEEPAWVQLWSMSLSTHARLFWTFSSTAILFSGPAADQNLVQRSKTQMSKSCHLFLRLKPKRERRSPCSEKARQSKPNALSSASLHGPCRRPHLQRK
ncbi:uncharacterized protein LOC142413535 isoform X2 [Mycteria americana]|uniref:uncharacterized protein LOC142413535 isoform X2 n=1 Tax=Mycteria americana TaxID=33587 RepID=UPI003F58D4B3